MQNRPKILLICNKWCEGKKLFGLSEWELGVQNSLDATGLADFQIIHLDEYCDSTQQKGDGEVLRKIPEYGPDIVYLIMFQMPGSSVNILDWSTLATIKNDFKIPIVALWGDLALPEQVKISKALLPYVSLNVATELTAALARINRPDKYLYMWVPRDPRVFNNPGKTRDIEMGYVGSPKKDRLKRILYLVKNRIKVVYGGGERQEHLTTEQYVDRYQRSKIALSFSRASVNHVINARPFEVMLCGAMLLEQESFETMKLYVPYVDYVPYTSKRDMLRKAKYYLSHDAEREKIAQSGERKTEELYSAKRFWQVVIERTLDQTSEKSAIIENAIPPESLSQLSPATAFRMRFLNSVCSTSVGFFVYKLWHFRYWQDGVYGHISKLKPLLQKLLPKKVFESLLAQKRKIY